MQHPTSMRNDARGCRTAPTRNCTHLAGHRSIQAVGRHSGRDAAHGSVGETGVRLTGSARAAREAQQWHREHCEPGGHHTAQVPQTSHNQRTAAAARSQRCPSVHHELAAVCSMHHVSHSRASCRQRVDLQRHQGCGVACSHGARKRRAQHRDVLRRHEVQRHQCVGHLRSVQAPLLAAPNVALADLRQPRPGTKRTEGRCQHSRGGERVERAIHTMASSQSCAHLRERRVT